MRELRFDAWEENTEWAPQIFVLLWAALMQYVPGKERDVSRRFEAVLDAFDEAKDQLPEDNFQLKRAGAAIALEDAKLDLVNKAWDQYAAKIPGQFIKARNKVDAFLEGTPTWTEKAWEEELKRRSSGEE